MLEVASTGKPDYDEYLLQTNEIVEVFEPPIFRGHGRVKLLEWFSIGAL